MRKRISVLLIAALLLSGFAPAFAATGADGASLERAIQGVRALVDISDDLTEFEYSAWEDPNYGTIWYLSWYDTRYTESVSASVGENGTLLHYNTFSGERESGLGTVSRSESQQIAEAFLEKALPGGMKDLKMDTVQTYNALHAFQYGFYPNGIPVQYVSVSIEVDTRTGKISGYSGYSLIVNSGDAFPEVGEPIGAAAAAAAYLENEGLALVYQYYFDWESQSISVFPVYRTLPYIYIDAATGERAQEYQTSVIPGARAYNTEDGASGADVQALTPIEREAVENVTGLLTRDAALRAALSIIPEQPANRTPNHASLSSAFEEKDKYIWSFNFEDMRVSVNARTGELIAYYNHTYQEPRRSSNVVAKERAQQTAFDYIKRAAPGKAELVALSEQMSVTDVPVPLIERELYASQPYVFVYTRQVNGIEFPGNSIYITVDAINGKILSYSLSWFDAVEFEPVDETIDAARAVAIFAEYNAYDLLYIKGGEQEAALVYGFLRAPLYFLDPITGERIGYDGKAYQEETGVQGYDDIAGKWYEDTVNKLLENGYYLEGEQFNGGAPITQEAFLRYLYAPMQSGYSQEQFYEMMLWLGVVKEDERAPDSALMRQDAAKFAIRSLGLDKAAQNGDVFRNVYRDEVDLAYRGYVMLANGLGIMGGDASGNFNGERALTRGEAAVVVLRTIENQ